MGGRAEQVDWGAGASMMVRRKLLESIGGMDENFFLYFEETEFCWRAKRAGFPMWYVPRSRVMHIGGQSTKVTERNAARKRLPDYWFESRRRYFLITAGVPRAMLVDLLAMLASVIGWLRLVVQGRRDRLTPHYIADLWRHSVLHRRNRILLAPRTQITLQR
jgi:hypothetical protein